MNATRLTLPLLLFSLSSFAQPPVLRSVGRVDRHILFLEFQEREVLRSAPAVYEPREGDRIEFADSTLVPLVEADGAVALRPRDRVLHRSEGDRHVAAGWITDRKEGGHWLWAEELRGEVLPAELLRADAFRLRTESGRELAPAALHRKRKPNDQQQHPGGGSDNRAYVHVLYLVFPEPLEEGRRHELRFGETSLAFEADSRRQPSEALHVNQIGFRPDDPLKRGFLSIWLGDGGAHAYGGVTEFEMIDEDGGETVWRGPVGEAYPADRPEQMGVAKNHTQTHVVPLDFSGLTRPGRYRLHVPGVGVSLPFSVGESVWRDAFAVSMRGLLSHRSGIALDAELLGFERPRPMHPADGFRVYALARTRLEGESEVLRRELAERLGDPPDLARLGEPLPEAWGGTMDAGDWDRRSQHLHVSQLLLELYELFPEYFRDLALALPAEERNNAVPDILDEALFNVDFYGRLQMEDGGVRGGIESTSHPVKGETSWRETLLVGAFGPDPVSSQAFAAAAARAARLLGPIDPERAAALLERAERAHAWAEANAERVLEEIAARSPSVNLNNIRAELARARLGARVELYRAGGHDALLPVIREGVLALPNSGNNHEALVTVFSLALDKGHGDGDLTAKTRDILRDEARNAMLFGRTNAFGLHNRVAGTPMMGYLGYYSVPEMSTGFILPRAHALFGEERYLRAALATTLFSAGANPDNLVYTTGAGQRFPRSVLHLDSRVSGTAPPIGITVYGPSDPAADFGFNSWVHQWHLQGMFPASRTWPAAEGYVDLFLWPAMTEYTVHQTLAPTAYYWGYLAARAAREPAAE